LKDTSPNLPKSVPSQHPTSLLALPFWGWKFSSHELIPTSVAILGHFFIPPFSEEIARFWGNSF
jgi:hypothetical protein